MPVTPHWGNADHTVIFLTYEKPWDWPAFDAAVVDLNAMLDTVHHPVDMLIVIRDGLPREINPQRFRKVMNNFHPNIRTTALIVANDLVRWSITAFVRVLGQDHHAFFFASNVDQALTRLGHSITDVQSAPPTLTQTESSAEPTAQPSM